MSSYNTHIVIVLYFVTHSGAKYLSINIVIRCTMDIFFFKQTLRVMNFQFNVCASVCVYV